MKIIPLSEGAFTIDGSKVFVPFDKQTDDLQDRPKGSLLVEIQPFVIVTDTDVILLDTGLGFSKNGVLQIHKNMEDNGINPLKVTKVLLSHLHKDHSGGIASKNYLLNKYVINFPNAIYYVSKHELDYAFMKGSLSYIPEELELLKTSEKIILLDEKGVIDNYIYYETSGGHCPYHTSFWLKKNDNIIFFGGDVAPQLQQMKSRFVAKYDHDGKKSMELRNQWWQQGQQEHWTFLFYHDIKTPFIKG